MPIANIRITAGDEKQLWTDLYINFLSSYSYTWLIWSILHEWYKSSMTIWAVIDKFQKQRVQRLWYEAPSVELNTWDEDLLLQFMHFLQLS